MTRLRQKYKKLKQKWDQNNGPRIKVVTKVAEVVTLCSSYTVDLETTLMDEVSLLRCTDSEAANEIVKKLLEEGYIERTIDKGLIKSTSVINYKLRVVKPVNY